MADLMRDVAAQPEQFSEERLQTEAETTQDVAQQLKQLAEQSPTSEQFGQPLRDALSDENQQQLNRQCQGLTQEMGAGQRGQAAQQLGETLDKISKAFDASVPHSGKGDRGEDRLRDHGENALTRGLRELESLARDEQRGATPDRDGAGESKQSGKAPAGNGNPTGNDGSQPPSTAGKPNQLTAGQ